MTIAIGGHTSYQQSGQAASGTTPPVTTSASGSTFVVWVSWYDASTVAPTITDTVGGVATGNVYTQVGTTGSNTPLGGSTRGALFECVNGVGGANHRFIVTFPSYSPFFCHFAAEITGALTVSPRDKLGNPVGVAYPGGTPPVTWTLPATGTTNQADEIVLGLWADENGGGTEVYDWSASSFTALETQGNTSNMTGATGYRVVSAIASYTPTFKYNLTGGFGVGASVSYKAAGGGGAVVAAPKAPPPVLPGTFNRRVPPFWPPSDIQRSLVNPASSGVIASASATAFGAALAAAMGGTSQTLVYAELPAPLVPGEFNRRVPPFWPPSDIQRSLVNPVLATIASASASSFGQALPGSPGLSVSPSSPTAFGLGTLACAGACIATGVGSCLGIGSLNDIGAVVASGFPGALGLGLPAESSVGIAAGNAGGIGLALCGVGPSCVAPSSPTSFGLGLALALGAVVVPGYPSTYGLALAGANGAAINGSFVTGTPTGLGLALCSSSGYGVAAGTPTALGLVSASAAAVLFALGRPTSISVAVAAETGASVVFGSGASAGGAWVAAAGAGINSSATPAYPASYGLGLASGSGYGVAVGSPAGAGQSSAAGSALAFAPSRPSALGSSAPAASGAGIESSNAKTIGLSFAFAGAVVIVPGFAVGTGASVGYSLVAAHAALVQQVLLPAPAAFCSPLIALTPELFTTPIIDRR